jgi:hypothetical protein
VEGNSAVGGLIGNYSSGTIINIFWNNHSGNVNNTFGSGSNINVTTIQDNISYFYGNSRSPMSEWDPVIWDFDNSSLSHLAYENYFISESLPGSVSVASLPSFGFGAVVLSLVGIIIFLF